MHEFLLFFLLDKCYFVQSRQSRCSFTVPILKNRLVYVNKIYIDCRFFEMDDKYLSYLSTIISWYKITSLSIHDPLDLCQLRLLVLKMINLRTLELSYHFDRNSNDDSYQQNLIDLFNDTSLCNMLMSNGLQKLHLYSRQVYPDMIGIASLLVKQLPHLQIIELSCHNHCDRQILEALHILINGLSKMNFIILHSGLTGKNQRHSIMHDPWKNSMRTYRIEYYIPSITIDETIVYFWLS